MLETLNTHTYTINYTGYPQLGWRVSVGDATLIQLCSIYNMVMQLVVQIRIVSDHEGLTPNSRDSVAPNFDILK